jgi:hypothetical protein
VERICFPVVVVAAAVSGHVIVDAHVNVTVAVSVGVSGHVYVYVTDPVDVAVSLAASCFPPSLAVGVSWVGYLVR